ncbi:hypothetical protein [Nocardioides sp. T2.26MG-1]|uniref:hypothetical protein n=1 Tax=Nocardioides sp. T2.26MG-1 TaxID=3041166 RepID=UPI00254178FC|nr:hypothetical protein [Nocardioides sp. T2.26MG-1]
MTGGGTAVLRRAAPAAWATVLAVLLLGPALGPGYLLTYDMVWVPDLALRSDFLGLGSALPRAVPSDAVVAVLDEVVPGMLLQKLMLLGALVTGGVGAAALAGSALSARLVAVSVYVWSPFVIERLWIGHWPLVLCWAVLPWLVRQGVRLREDPRVGSTLPVLLLIGSLSANAGLMAAATLLAVGATRRSTPRMVALLLAANAPWLVAGVLHVGEARSSSAGAVFGLDAEGTLPAPVAALTSGGIWNAEVVPDSRTQLLLPLVLTLVIGALAVAGYRPMARRLGRRTTTALVVLWAIGYAVAIVSWATPDLVGWLAETLPAGGLLRDGSRWLALCAPLTAVVVAEGATRWAGRVPQRFAVAAALVPLAFMPDAAWGVGGTLRPADYPDDWAVARSELGDGRGDLLVLPFTSYRQPAWNHDHKVLDPLPRFLEPNYVVNDELAVDGRIIAGEDPRVPDVLDALALPSAGERADALGALGIGAVARDLSQPVAGYEAPVAGTVVHRGAGLEVTLLDVTVDRRDTPAEWWVALLAAWTAYVGLAAVAVANLVRRVAPRMAVRPRDG